MKVFLLSILNVLILTMDIMGQQDPQFSHFMYNHAFNNPGAAGNSGKICATLINNNRYLGLEGAPVTFAANVSAPFTLFNVDQGVGVVISNDQYGFYSDMTLSLSYAVQLSVGDGKLGIGLNGGLYSSTLKNPNWQFTDGGIQHSSTDEAIPQGSEENAMAFNANFGAFYSNNDIFIGISSSKLLEPSLEFLGSGETTATTAEYQLKRHYFITAGYSLQLPNPSFEVKPSVLVKYGSSAQIDVNAILEYNKKVWGGVTYRVNEAVIMGGLELTNNLRLGISYDYNYAKIRNAQSGTVELMLNYCFEIDRDKELQKYRSIRYL